MTKCNLVNQETGKFCPPWDWYGGYPKKQIQKQGLITLEEFKAKYPGRLLGHKEN